MTLLLGLDVGTTSVKAVVYRTDGIAVGSSSLPTPTHVPRPGWAFYRPEELWQTAVAAIRGALAGVPHPEEIASVAVASVGESGVLLDAAGAATTDSIAWFDTRTRPQATWLAERIGKDELFARSGLSLQPIFSLNKLLWHREHEPDAWARSVRWLMLADYIAYRLCGEAATDLSLASRTLMLNLRQKCWDEQTLAEAEIDPGLLAPLVPGGTLLGTCHAERRRAHRSPDDSCRRLRRPGSCLRRAGGRSHPARSDAQLAGNGGGGVSPDRAAIGRSQSRPPGLYPGRARRRRRLLRLCRAVHLRRQHRMAAGSARSHRRSGCLRGVDRRRGACSGRQPWRPLPASPTAGEPAIRRPSFPGRADRPHDGRWARRRHSRHLRGVGPGKPASPGVAAGLSGGDCTTIGGGHRRRHAKRPADAHEGVRYQSHPSRSSKRRRRRRSAWRC